MTTTKRMQEEGLHRLATCGVKYVIGVDEVGYGSWAGPIVVCAAALPATWRDERVKDSKELKARTRKHLIQSVLPEVVVTHQILAHDSQTIDKMGVSKARDDLVAKAAKKCLERASDALIVMDGNVLPGGLPSNAICFPKADSLVPAVSAASVLAKVFRDEIMQGFHEEYPWYDFGSNVGYGTKAHQEGLDSKGPCPIHRFSYHNIQQAAAQHTNRQRAVAKLGQWRPSQNAMPGSIRSNKR